MLMVVSPAKALNFVPPEKSAPLTTPQLREETALLSKTTARLKRGDLKKLMGISDALADLNYQRFQAFDPESEDGLQAAFAFDGDVYKGLGARELDKPSLAWMQDRLRILSGLYGLLRPMDAIQPYRLEMGSAVKTRRGSNLYAFWGPRIAEALSADLDGHADDTLVNLASQEYFGAVSLKALKRPVITCHFKEQKEGVDAKIISFFAKRARGRMARYAIDNRIDRAEGLKSFDADGYAFRPDLSGETDWVFLRHL
ncbi:MAG: hypothetical protein BGN86_02200 [Caulobacterales bacterium 68-7]|nr:peroxide stress protein YaaA [Caulobacterales bacterium]OJU10031.1 MAG: hypothetical protein BGN86_02200 [Caulobacterales bacterium 68-7]